MACRIFTANELKKYEKIRNAEHLGLVVEEISLCENFSWYDSHEL